MKVGVNWKWMFTERGNADTTDLSGFSRKRNSDGRWTGRVVVVGLGDGGAARKMGW